MMWNTSSIGASSALHCDYTPDSQSSLPLLVMILEVVVGLPGNLLALWIFCFHMKTWKPHAVFLFNLMLADILVLGSVPFRISTYLQGDDWIFGHMFCRINLFMLAANRSASIGFMTIVALNRYIKVLHPFCRVSSMSLRHTMWLSLFIWCIVIILRIPLLTLDLLRQEDNRSICHGFGSYEKPPLAITVHYVAYLTEFILPWILLIFCSVRIICFLKKQEKAIQKKTFKKAIRSIIVINLVFTICFLPAFLSGLGSLAIKTFKPQDCEGFKKMALTFMQCVNLTYLNCALDPVIYTFSSSMFRTALTNVFKKLCVCGGKARDAEGNELRSRMGEESTS